jgi:hypothetical protein
LVFIRDFKFRRQVFLIPGGTYEEDKKIGGRDAVSAIIQITRFHFRDEIGNFLMAQT